MRPLILALGLALAGCDGGATEACDVDAATRCMNNAAETCTDGAWEVTDDCEADGATCHQEDGMADGAAHCM